MTILNRALDKAYRRQRAAVPADAVAGLPTEPQGLTEGLLTRRRTLTAHVSRSDVQETCGRGLGGVRRPAPNGMLLLLRRVDLHPGSPTATLEMRWTDIA